MFTKEQTIQVGTILYKTNAKNKVCIAFIALFKEDNIVFDKDKFIAACVYKNGKRPGN